VTDDERTLYRVLGEIIERCIPASHGPLGDVDKGKLYTRLERALAKDRLTDAAVASVSREAFLKRRILAYFQDVRAPFVALHREASGILRAAEEMRQWVQVPVPNGIPLLKQRKDLSRSERKRMIAYHAQLRGAHDREVRWWTAIEERSVQLHLDDAATTERVLELSPDWDIESGDDAATG
jgi:hypothetical protein